jgi:hypothetical protein
MVQQKGGDSRLNMYIFAFYDRIGYIIYGVNDIGLNYCSEIFEYKNYLSINNKIKIFSKSIKSFYIKKKNKKILNKKSLINYNKKYSFVFKEINLQKINLINNYT